MLPLLWKYSFWHAHSYFSVHWLLSSSCTQFTLFHPLVQIIYTCAVYTIYPTISFSYLPQALPNHFSSHSSLTSMGMKFWAIQLFKHAFLTKFKLLRILAPNFPLTYKTSTVFNSSFFWHTQWKYNITIMYFLTIKFLHFSPNTICEHFKKQQIVKKLDIPKHFYKPTWTEIFGS